MDMNTLMSMIGMFGGGANMQAAPAPRHYTPGLADFSQLGNVAATIAAPVAAPSPAVEQAPVTPQYGHGPQGNAPHVLSAAPAAPVQPTVPVRKGGFSTGNILSALLGSNFGQK